MDFQDEYQMQLEAMEEQLEMQQAMEQQMAQMQYAAGRQAYSTGSFFDRFDGLTYSPGDSLADQIRNTNRFMWKKQSWKERLLGTKSKDSPQFEKFDLPVNFADPNSLYGMMPGMMGSDFTQPQLSEKEKAKQEAEQKKAEDAAREKSALDKAQKSLSSGASPLIKGAGMPYGAGFGAPGPSLADKFAFTGEGRVSGGDDEITVNDAVDVIEQPASIE